MLITGRNGWVKMVLCTNDGKHDYLLVKMSSLSRYPGSANGWGFELGPWCELMRHVQIPVPNISLSPTTPTLGAIDSSKPVVRDGNKIPRQREA